MPRKFMVAANQPHKYNILFSDHDTFAYINSIIKKVKLLWVNALEQNAALNKISNSALFVQKMGSEEFKKAAEELKEISYWHEGEYSANIIVITEKPQRVLETKKVFFLKKEDFEKLNQNYLIIMQDLCNQPGALYNYTYPNLLNIDDK